MGGCCGVAANGEKKSLPEQEELQKNGSTDVKLPEDGNVADDETKVQSSDNSKSPASDNIADTKEDSDNVHEVNKQQKVEGQVSEQSKETAADATKKKEESSETKGETQCQGSHCDEQTANGDAVNQESIKVELQPTDANKTVDATPLDHNDTENSHDTPVNGVNVHDKSGSEVKADDVTSGSADQHVQSNEINGTVESVAESEEMGAPLIKLSPGTEVQENEIQS